MDCYKEEEMNKMEEDGRWQLKEGGCKMGIRVDKGQNTVKNTGKHRRTLKIKVVTSLSDNHRKRKGKTQT